jgi:RNA polymerase primary sigma factor
MSQQLRGMRKSNLDASTPDFNVSMNRQITRSSDGEVIRRTRQLMERSIEFISQPFYGSIDAIELIEAKRPASLNEPRDGVNAEYGRTFISSLVAQPQLSIEEQRYWFDLMNFLKYRAEQNRRLLDLSRLDARRVKQIDDDLDEALRIRNHIIESNLRLVVALAKQFSRLPGQIYDLISEGMPPLIRSVELFDVGSGNHFSTYATWSVRNEIQRFLKRRKMSSVWFPNDNCSSLEKISDTRSDRASDQLESREDLHVVHRLLASLSERERRVILARFGLDGQSRRPSLAAIGAEVGLCGERVRQLIASALAKLKNEIQSEEEFFID